MRRLLRAPNPGPMTLEGTNTWLVGARRVLVVDPGPADDGHVDAVLAEVAREGGTLGAVLLTHRHHDHSDALGHPTLRRALETTGAPVLALDPSFGAVPDPPVLATACDEPVHVRALPGHTDDSLALVLPERREVCTGDTVLGRGTSVVAHPDGDLRDYLASLAALQELVTGASGRDRDGTAGAERTETERTETERTKAERTEAERTETERTETERTETERTETERTETEPWVGLPGHGPVIVDLAPVLQQLLQHRRARVGQVVRALRSLGRADLDGAADDDGLVAGVVGLVYPELTDHVLIGAADRTVRATLVHLGRPDSDPR